MVYMETFAVPEGEALRSMRMGAAVLQALMHVLMSEMCTCMLVVALQSCFASEVLESEEFELSEECRAKCLEPHAAPDSYQRVSRKFYSEWLLAAKKDEDEDEDEEDEDEEEEDDDDNEEGGEEGGEGEEDNEGEDGEEEEEDDDDDDDGDEDEDEDEDGDEQDDEDGSPPKKARK